MRHCSNAALAHKNHRRVCSANRGRPIDKAMSSVFSSSTEAKKSEEQPREGGVTQPGLAHAMEFAQRVYSEPNEVRLRLEEMGLTVRTLHGSALASEIGRARATANHPPVTGGFNGWADGVAALRDALMPQGWSKCDAKGYSTTVSPDDYRQIAVASGDRETGNPNGMPRTKSPKGPVTARAVHDNNQLSMLAQLGIGMESSDVDDIESGVEPQRETWILLIARYRNELRVELSRPATMDDDDRVATWLERIILPTIDLDRPGIGGALPAPEPGPDFDVTVTRRIG